MNTMAVRAYFDALVDDFCQGKMMGDTFTELAVRKLYQEANGSKSDTLRGNLIECLVHSVNAVEKRVDGERYTELRRAMHKAQDRFFAK